MCPAERKLIEYLEKDEGRKLTDQEVNLALEQARAFGALD